MRTQPCRNVTRNSALFRVLLMGTVVFLCGLHKYFGSIARVSPVYSFVHSFETRCDGLQHGFETFSFGVDKWPCEAPISNVGYDQWRSVENLKKFERYLTLGTYEGDSFLFTGPGRFPLPPSSRFHTLSYAFAEFESKKGQVIVEVSTSRSFQHSSGPGCNLDDPNWWHPKNPEDWDWGAGHFTHLACTSLAHLLKKGQMFTVDLLSSHLERSRLMTKECAEYMTYKVQSSTDFFNEFDTKSYGQIDLLYLDTGDMTPVEVSAELHLEEARIVVERRLVRPGGLVLIDDVRNLAPKKYGEPAGDTYGKAKYSIDYFLAHGFSLVKSEYQVILRNSIDSAVVQRYSKSRRHTENFRVFHVSYHLGCLNEFKYVANELGFEVDSLLWEGNGDGNEKYNINHDRAEVYWELLKYRANEADVVLVSDTAPLSRIFLQNGFPGKLVIWICNRFDYKHGDDMIPSDELEKFAGEHPKAFPTHEYYNLIRAAALSERVAIVSYTAFEHIYARSHRKVELGNETIKPTGYGFSLPNGIQTDARGEVPADVDKSSTFFIPPYQNDKRLPKICETYNLKCYMGRYAGPLDVVGFRGIIHVPYAWSNFALFEMIAQGVPYLIPSKDFLLSLEDIFWSPPFDKANLDASEWYDPTLSSLFIYFDSWEHLPDVISSTDFEKKSQVMKAFMGRHKRNTIKQWRNVFAKL